MAGTKTWADGDVVTAADLNGFVRDQWITVCTAGTRPTTTQEGRTIFETDTDRYYWWNGASWADLATVGAWPTWTPTVTQGVTPTSVNVASRYHKVGRSVTAMSQKSFSTTGTAATAIYSTLPFNASFTNQNAIGTFNFYDGTGVQFSSGVVLLIAANQIAFLAGGSGVTNFLGVSPAYTIVNGSVLSFTITYESTT